MGLDRFKRFTSTDKGFVPNVSIWNKGRIWIGSGAVNKFDLDRFTHVVFLYDETAREIGLLFRGNDKEEGAVKLGKRQTGIVVAAKNFLDCFNIDYSQTKQYLMRVEQEPDLFVISLDQGKVSTKSKGEPDETAPERKAEILKVVRTMRRKPRTGGRPSSYQAIADRLNAAGMPPLKGGEWSAQAVRGFHKRG